jgi:hypothetical protein
MERHGKSCHENKQDNPHQQEGYRAEAFRLIFHVSSSVTLPEKNETLCRQSRQENQQRKSLPQMTSSDSRNHRRVSFCDSEKGGGGYIPNPWQTGHVCVGTNAITSPTVATRITPPTRKVIPRPEVRELGIAIVFYSEAEVGSWTPLTACFQLLSLMFEGLLLQVDDSAFASANGAGRSGLERNLNLSTPLVTRRTDEEWLDEELPCGQSTKENPAH